MNGRPLTVPPAVERLQDLIETSDFDQISGAESKVSSPEHSAHRRGQKSLHPCVEQTEHRAAPSLRGISSQRDQSTRGGQSRHYSQGCNQERGQADGRGIQPRMEQYPGWLQPDATGPIIRAAKTSAVAADAAVVFQKLRRCASRPRCRQLSTMAAPARDTMEN